MPYPAQINRDDLVRAAVDMIESGGVDGFSMHKLAAAFGVKTPSLYRYFRNRTDLLRAINTETFRGLFRAMQPALESDGSPADRARRIAQAYRAYAHAHPTTYGLAYTNTIHELRPDESEQATAVRPYQALMAEITGEADSLAALRGFLALMHGFVMLELSGQYRRGGSLDDAYAHAVEVYLAGLG